MPSVEADGWLVRFQPVAAVRVRMFCFPHAGGSAWDYRDWPEWLPIGVEVFGIQLPGRGHRANVAPFVRLAPLLDELVGRLIPHLDRPFAFFGHSLGALTGFEVARRLDYVQERPPDHLVLSGRGAPTAPRTRPAIHALPDDDFLQEVQRFDGLPPEVLADAELKRLMLPALRADFALSETHRHVIGPRLSCPIAVFGGDADVDVPVEHLEPWGEQTTAGCTVDLFHGGHFFLRRDTPQVLSRLATRLGTTCFGRAGSMC